VLTYPQWRRRLCRGRSGRPGGPLRELGIGELPGKQRRRHRAAPTDVGGAKASLEGLTVSRRGFVILFETYGPQGNRPRSC
jgi:hypothetical protein